MRRIAVLPFALALLLAALAAGTAFAAVAHSGHPTTLTIRHQVHGCHSWSYGGTWKASQQMTLHAGSFLTVVDNDVMPHTMVQTSGTKVRITHAAMRRMGARASLFFGTPGTYRFKTKAGEDYPGMMSTKTVGEDNLLRLTVIVR